MSQPTIRSIQCLSPAGLHRMAYKEWGEPDNGKVLVCVHGVTRLSDDFDFLARELCKTYRVICPDVAGRGRSSRLRDPQYYQIPQYVSDMVTLLARANADTVSWVGTSMGGLIGMGLAALADTPISRLVLNDVGPALNESALRRIGNYIGATPRFSAFEEAARYIRDISLPFGPHSEEQWRKLAGDVLIQDEEGSWTTHYDPRIADPFKLATPESTSFAEQMLWHTYDAITCPTLLLHGAESDLLLPETIQEMAGRGPKATCISFANVGHAPTLVHRDQVEVIREFLEQPDSIGTT